MRRDLFLFLFFSPNEQRAGGGGGRALPDFFFFFFPCSADHERDWPPCKVVFFGLATNGLNMRNNNFRFFFKQQRFIFSRNLTDFSEIS